MRDHCPSEYSIEQLRKTPENNLRYPNRYAHTGILIPHRVPPPPPHTHTHTHTCTHACTCTHARTHAGTHSLKADCPCLPSQVKCEHYWPLDAQPCIHGQLQVMLISEEASENWTVRHLQLFHVSPSNPTRTPQGLPAVRVPEKSLLGIETSGASTPTPPFR